MPNHTETKTLAEIRTELMTTFSPADWESYNHLVGWLRDTDVAGLPAFAAPADEPWVYDGRIVLRTSGSLRARGRSGRRRG